MERPRSATAILLRGAMSPAEVERRECELERQRKGEADARYVASRTVELWVCSYVLGEITFERLMENVQHALGAPPVKEYLWGVDRDRLLAWTIRCALASMPGKERWRSPSWLQEMCFALVNRVAEDEGLPKAQETGGRMTKKRMQQGPGQTAFDRVSEMLTLRGVSMTSAGVRYAYDQFNSSKRKLAG